YGSAVGSRQRASCPRGCGEIDRTTIPPRLRQDTQSEVPGCIFQTGADVDGPNEVVDEPLVIGLPARRRVLPAGPCFGTRADRSVYTPRAGTAGAHRPGRTTRRADRRSPPTSWSRSARP